MDLNPKEIFRKPKWFWVLCGLVILSNIGCYLFLVRPKGIEVFRLQDAYGRLRAERLSILKEGQSEFYQLEEKISVFLKQIPPSQAFPLWVSDLYNQIQKNGLVSSRMVYKPKEAAFLGLVQYNTSFSVKGPYAKLRRLLADIQNSRQLYCIEAISLVNHSNVSRENVEMKLELSTYFR